MKYPELKLHLQEIDLIGEVAAGRIVPFIPRGKKLRIPFATRKAQAETCKAIEIKGDSLKDLNIPDGANLVFNTSFHISEITPEKVCVVYIHTTGDLIARRLTYNENGTVTLRAANEDYPDRTFDADEIEIRGLVFKCVFNLTLAINFLFPLAIIG